MNSVWSRGLDRVLRSDFAATLAAPHGVERYLEQWNPLWSLDQVKARVVAVSHPAPDAVVIRLAPNRHWTGFRAGQYVRVGVEVDGVRLTRCYSIASHPGEREIEIAVRRQGRVSTALFEHVGVGAVLTLSPAAGDFLLPEASRGPLLFVAGGSGITPIRSMLLTLAGHSADRPVALVYYVRDAATALYAGELRTLFAARPGWQLAILPTRGADPRSTRFGAATLAALRTEFRRAPAWVCGPASLIDAVDALLTAEQRRDDLHCERFAAAPATGAAAGAGGGELRFTRSERYVADDGRSLLDQAEAAGLSPDAGCRMGICHSCLCRKTAGRVRDLRTGALSDDGDEDIQLCVSAAVGDVTLDL